MNRVFDTQQITSGQSFAQWHQHDNIPEDTMDALRTDIATVLRKIGRRCTSAEVYEALGTNEAKPKVMAALIRMKKDGEIKTFPGESPRKTLYAIASSGGDGGEAPPKTAKAARKAAKKRGNCQSKNRRGRAPALDTPAVATQGTAPCNVRGFIPAMTADKRMVLVGGSEPLLFSTEQTQSIADLIFGNFEAS